MREFVSKPKKFKVTIGNKEYQMRNPTLGEAEQFDLDRKEVGPENIMSAYKKFFAVLGLPEAACNQMDSDDFIEFIKFVMSPNSQGSQPTA